jgi:NMD protein affecting ribosome stability and mRNA decay
MCKQCGDVNDLLQQLRGDDLCGKCIKKNHKKLIKK